MKKSVLTVILFMLAVLTRYAQETQFTPQEQEMIDLSNQKWLLSSLVFTRTLGD